MPYDKYRNWGPDLPIHEGIKKQVLIDLEGCADDIERLEILDSFEVYVERQNLDELAEWIADRATRNIMMPLLSAFLKEQIPKPMPVSRPRRAVCTERQK